MSIIKYTINTIETDVKDCIVTSQFNYCCCDRRASFSCTVFFTFALMK